MCGLSVYPVQGYDGRQAAAAAPKQRRLLVGHHHESSSSLRQCGGHAWSRTRTVVPDHGHLTIAATLVTLASHPSIQLLLMRSMSLQYHHCLI